MSLIERPLGNKNNRTIIDQQNEAIKELKSQLAQQKALLDEAVKVIKIAEHISDEDEADIVMDYAKAFIEKEKNGN